MTAEIIYLHQKRNIDPVLTAYEELKNLEIILSSLPDGDEADVIICRIRECEVRIISWQAQSHSGLVAQLGLLRSWENEGTAPSRSFIVAGGKLVAIFISDWARRLAGWIDGIAMIAQARRTRARYRRPRAHQRVILRRVYRHRGRKIPPLSWRYRGPSRSTLQPLDKGVQDHEVPPNRSDQVGRVPGEPSTPEIYDRPQPTPSCRLPFAVAGRHLPLPMPSKGASMASDLPGIWRMSKGYLGISESRLGGAVKGYGYQISQQEFITFKRQGYVLLRDFFDPRIIRRVQEISDEMSANAASILNECRHDHQSPAERASMRPDELIVVPESQNPKQVCRYEYMIGSSPAFRGILETIIVPTLSLLIKDPVVAFKDKTNEKLPGGGGFRPHQDFVAYQYFGPRYNINALISINSSNRQNGCVQFAQNFAELVRKKPDSVKLAVEGRHIFRYEEGDRNHGDIVDEIANQIVWDEIETNPSDLVIFDSFVPHFSELNLSVAPRRAIFVTFNREREGRWYDRYYAEKRSNYHDPKFHVSTPTWREGSLID